MRKFSTILVLVVLLVAAIAMPVFATDPEVKNITITATSEASDTWEWSIPTSIAIDGTTSGSTGSFNIEVTVTTINPGYGVDVVFEGSTNGFKLVRSGTPATEVSYQLWCSGNAVTTADQVIATGITSYSVSEFAATLTQNITTPGTYSDVLGFSTSVSEIQ